MPKYGNPTPGSQKWNFSKFFHVCGKVSRFRFQRALNQPQILSLSQVMQRDVILVYVYYAQIWKFGPGPQNIIFQNFFIFVERSPDFASNEPSTTPDINFKSSYARKRDFGLLCPNMEIRPQAPKNGIFQNFFMFVERSPDFASNEPSTSPRY